MNNDYRKRRLLRLSVITHVVCAALLLTALHFCREKILLPVVEKQRATRQRSEQLNEMLKASSDVSAKHVELVTSLRDIRRREDEALERIPDESREDEFLQVLTSKASQRTVKVKDYRRESVVSQNGYNELGINIACSGEFAAVCGLLHDLTTLSRVVHVKNMTLTQSNQDGICDLTMDLALFFGAAKPNRAG